MTAPRIIFEHDRAAIFHGDSELLELPEGSVDAIVSDPPAGIGFMGKSWDKDKGGRDQWQAWLARLLAASFRALKPGGHALLWGIPRTSHWTMSAIEDAGFEIRDVVHDAIAGDELVQQFISTLDDEQRQALARAVESQSAPIWYQIFGSGFPKSLNISKAIDAAAGAERAKVGEGRGRTGAAVAGHADVHGDDAYEWPGTFDITVPATDDAKKWDGWGTALKPAVEHWILARKPLTGTYVENVLEWGVGGINVDACRIGMGDEYDPSKIQRCQTAQSGDTVTLNIPGHEQATYNAAGRWPAHLVLEHAEGCLILESRTEARPMREHAGRSGNVFGAGLEGSRAIDPVNVTRDVYECAPGCPVRTLDEQSGERKSGGGGMRTTSLGMMNDDGWQPTVSPIKRPPPDKGGASRFFYVAKAPRSEKDAGLEHLPRKTGGEATGREDGAAGVSNPRAGAGRTGGARNSHPTVKGLALMRWLVRLVTPPGGVVLDPFAGSGSTGVAALEEGFSFIGCELTDEYLPILLGRVRHALELPQHAPEDDPALAHLRPAAAVADAWPPFIEAC